MPTLTSLRPGSKGENDSQLAACQQGQKCAAPSRYSIINPLIGNPIKVSPSCVNRLLVTLSARLTLRMMRAVQNPQGLQCHKPNQAIAQATQTAAISRTAIDPMLANPSCARGFRRGNVSNKVPGSCSITAARPLVSAPNAKKKLSAVRRQGMTSARPTRGL
jgi:hypothetical protein